MKKIIPLVVLSLSVLFSSCLKNSSYKPSPIAPGFSMYQNVQMQQLLSLDAANVAFRLNILLTTAEEQGIGYDELNTVSVEYDGTTVNVANRLFGSAGLSEENGVWTLTFTGNTSPSESYTRSGKLIIDTKNKLLSELSNGEAWSITGDKDFMITMGGAVFYSDYQSPTYQITHMDDYAFRWMVSTSGFTTYQSMNTGTPVKSNWMLSIAITQNGVSQSYVDARKSTYTVSGQASGKPLGWSDVDFDYETVTALQYKASCGGSLITGGKETVSAPSLVVSYPNSFPYSSVSVQWGEGTNGECSNTYKIFYGPYTYDSTTGQTTGGVE